MNKHYFAKYLPVEGEIKVGDKIRSESASRSAVTVTHIDKDGYLTNEEDLNDPLGGSFYVVSREKAIKVKLFLCSRDIQVGDKVEKTDSLSKYWDLESENDVRIAKEQDFFKVIGEILTEGIKEGQEFIDKNVEYLTIKRASV